MTLIREITAAEVENLRECLEALSAYHNEVSVNFKGTYPSRPYAKTLEMFSEALRAQDAYIAVVEADAQIVGFCKVDIHADGTGKLDYLMLLEKYRGCGYGKTLMDWAMAKFTEHGVRNIEVKVVDGNPAQKLYEKYGFQMNAHILVRATS